MRLQSFSLAALVCLSVPFFNGCAGGTPSTSGQNTTNTAPTVTSISPASVSAGAAATTLTVTGTGFISTTAIQLGGTLEPTTYVSATQVTAAIPASQLTSGVALSVIAINGTSSSSSGGPINLTVNNPAPTITAMLPASFVSGAASATVSITGTGFVPSTTVQANGNTRSTTFISSTQVNVILTAADFATAGSINLIAVNPTPGGGSSAAASLAVNNAIPTVISLAPNVVTTGATAATTVTVTGTNFLAASTVQVGTASRTTTYVSATKLTFLLTVADQAAVARLGVSVVTPSPGGGTSNIVSLTVAAPTPTPVVTYVSPTQLVVDSGASSIVVAGTNLTTSCSVLWNGTPLAVLYEIVPNAVYLLGTVPASLLTSTGTASVTVSCPTATPAVSNATTVNIVNPPPPTLTSLSPSSGPIRTATTVTLTGTGFTAASTVAFNGTTVTSTYVNQGELTVALPASTFALPGTGSFTITTPAPGGGTSAALLYTAYIGIVNNNAVYNPVNGLFYVSVPSSAGAPYGDSVVSVDPETGNLGAPIPVGSEPNKLAVTADGKYLWVGLDGAGAVRKVDLTAGTAGLQFSLGGNGGIYETPPTAVALAALPGATDSVIVSSSNNPSPLAITIFDSGVARASTGTSSYYINEPYALQVDGTKNEIYAGGAGYTTYTYSANGVTAKATSTTSATYASYSSDEMQLAGTQLFTDYGGVYDPESGSLLGTLYSTGTTAASGPTVADTTLGKAFVLDDSIAYSYGSYNQIQIFNISNYTTTATTIPISVSTGITSGATRLTRWGANGLAFRTAQGIYSLRSNLVQDLSSVSADLGVTLTAAATGATGANTTFTATITNAGPSASTNIALAATAPSNGVLISMTPSAGTCSVAGATCNMGGLASGASATITLVVQQLTAGSSTLTVQVSGAETDPTPANNSASATVTISGSAFSLAPAITSISPAAVLAGSTDTTLTVNGTGFNSSSTVLLGGATLSTSYVSSTQLTATVPATNIASMGWSAIAVSTPAPGGGTSNTVPLTVYTVLTVGVNHILYEPFTRKLYASVGSGSATITGNSIAAITPETATIGTPVNVGSQPTKMAISDDGNIMYALLGGANSIARFNLQTKQTEFTISPTITNYGSLATGFRDVAVQTGSETTIAVDFGYTEGMGLFDINPTAKTGTERGTTTGIYTGSSLHFYNPQTLYLFNIDTWQTLDDYTITSAGFSYSPAHTSSTLLRFGTFQLAGKIGFADAGGVADVTTTPATQLGYYNPLVPYGATQHVAADTSLARVFFLSNTSSTDTAFSNPDGIVGYNQTTFMPTTVLPINMAAIEGNTSYTGIDLVRWGQDGLAALTSGGHIYLLRGPVVVPQELTTNSAATLASSSATTLTHGAGNTLLTLTGSNFVPGVAVTWNGSYRTTTIISPTQVTVAIPASDLASTGTGSLVATNPGAAASSALTVTIN